LARVDWWLPDRVLCGSLWRFGSMES
jgi:hypothetical protein